MQAQFDVQQSKKLVNYQQKLNLISNQLEDYPQPLDQCIRKYVATYIQARTKTQQFFPVLCQHNIFQRILSKNNSSKVHLSQCTCLLQCINLLMSNTKITNQIVYFLSQSSLHEYLFNPNILKQSPEFIQYYIRLLKTILLKLTESSQNKSFIKLFCNQRYPSFPIFQFCVVLGAYEDNQLVKVTAQHCVLILIGLINQYTIFQSYLSELGLVLMVSKLIITADQKVNNAKKQGNISNYNQMEELSKYLVDLIYELRQNRTPLLLINNILCNLIIMRNVPHNWTDALKFIISFSSCLCLRIQQNYKELQQPIIDNLLIICVTHLRIICKLTTNIFISGCMLSNFVSINSQPLINLNSDMFPNQFQQCKTLNQLLNACTINFIPQVWQEDGIHSPGRKNRIKMKQKAKSQSDLTSDYLTRIINISREYQGSRQINKLKESYQKKLETGKFGKQASKNDSIFSFLFKKTDWVKKISLLAGVQLEKGKIISKGFHRHITPQTSVFLQQYASITKMIDQGIKISDIKFGQHASTCEQTEIYHNRINNHFKFTRYSLILLNILADEYKIFHDESLEGLTFQSSFFMEEHTVISKLYVPYYQFIVLHFRQYLSLRLHEITTACPKNKEFLIDIKSISLLCQFCEKIGVNINKQKYKFKGMKLQFDQCYRKITDEMKIINQYVQTCAYQGDIAQIGGQYWRMRDQIFHKLIIQKKQKIKSMIPDDKTDKKRGKKKMMHRDRVKAKMQQSLSSIKQNKQLIISQIKSPTSKTYKKKQQKQDKNQSMGKFFTRKMILYECLQRIVFHKAKKLDEYFEEQWSLNTIPDQNQEYDQFSSVISSDNSLVTVQQIIKQFTVSYFDRPEYKLSFIKLYFPPKIMLNISHNGKTNLEIPISDIIGIQKNKINKRLLHITTINHKNSQNLETIKTYDEIQSKKLINKFKQCQQMQSAVLSGAIFAYLSDTYAYLNQVNNNQQRKQKKNKKIQIIQSSPTSTKNVHKFISQSYQQTPRGQ